MGYTQRSVFRACLLCEDYEVSGTPVSITGVSGMLDIESGAGLAVSAVANVRADKAQADAWAVIALETQLPGGAWHIFGRWNRVAAALTDTGHLLEKNALKLDSHFTVPSNAIALTDAADFTDDIFLVGPVRARYILGRGGATSVVWSLQVDVAIIGQAGIVS